MTKDELKSIRRVRQSYELICKPCNKVFQMQCHKGDLQIALDCIDCDDCQGTLIMVKELKEGVYEPTPIDFKQSTFGRQLQKSVKDND